MLHPRTIKGHSIIESQQFADPGVLEEFVDRTEFYEPFCARRERLGMLSGKRGGLVFYEPSTRTRWSFEAAIVNLGGDFSNTENAEAFSSAAKGERLEHSVRVLSAYVNFIILRHSDDNAAQVAQVAHDYLQSLGRATPIINAGCGKGQHPTQALIDWWTIRKQLGRTSDLRICIVGDLARGRTVRSLAYLMGRQRGVAMDFVSPPELAMGEDILEYLQRHGISYSQGSSIDGLLEQADVVYMTRAQTERPHGSNLSQVDKSGYRLTLKRARAMKKGAILMHPMPINDEIEAEVDQLPQAVYFNQSDNGVPVRMALLDMMLCS